MGGLLEKNASLRDMVMTEIFFPVVRSTPRTYYSTLMDERNYREKKDMVCGHLVPSKNDFKEVRCDRFSS